MSLLVLQATTGANGDGNVVYPQNVKHKQYGVYQVNITGTATVTLYGRTSANMPWQSIKQYTGPGSDLVTLYPEMKDTVSGFSSGTIRSEIWE